MTMLFLKKIFLQISLEKLTYSVGCIFRIFIIEIKVSEVSNTTSLIRQHQLVKYILKNDIY